MLHHLSKWFVLHHPEQVVFIWHSQPELWGNLVEHDGHFEIQDGPKTLDEKQCYQWILDTLSSTPEIKQHIPYLAKKLIFVLIIQHNIVHNKIASNIWAILFSRGWRHDKYWWISHLCSLPVSAELSFGASLLVEPTWRIKCDNNIKQKEGNCDKRDVANHRHSSILNSIILENLSKETRARAGGMFISFKIKRNNVFTIILQNPKIHDKIITTWSWNFLECKHNGSSNVREFIVCTTLAECRFARGFGK